MNILNDCPLSVMKNFLNMAAFKIDENLFEKWIYYKLACKKLVKMLCNSSNNTPDILKLAEVKKPKMR